MSSHLYELVVLVVEKFEGMPEFFNWGIVDIKDIKWPIGHRRRRGIWNGRDVRNPGDMKQRGWGGNRRNGLLTIGIQCEYTEHFWYEKKLRRGVLTHLISVWVPLDRSPESSRTSADEGPRWDNFCWGRQNDGIRLTIFLMEGNSKVIGNCTPGALSRRERNLWFRFKGDCNCR